LNTVCLPAAPPVSPPHALPLSRETLHVPAPNTDATSRAPSSLLAPAQRWKTRLALRLNHSSIRQCSLLFSAILSPNRSRAQRYNTVSPRSLPRRHRPRECCADQLVCAGKAGEIFVTALWGFFLAGVLIVSALLGPTGDRRSAAVLMDSWPPGGKGAGVRGHFAEYASPIAGD